MFGVDKLSKERKESLTAVLGLVTVTVLTVVGFQLQAYNNGTSTLLHSAEFQAMVIGALD